MQRLAIRSTALSIRSTFRALTRGVTLLSALLLLSLSTTGLVYGTDAWTQTQILRVDGKAQPTGAVDFTPTITEAPTIRTVSVVLSGKQLQQVQYEAYLCAEHSNDCVELVGDKLQTHRFEGQPAQQRFHLQLNVQHWGVHYPPLFVPSTITVHY